VTVSAAPMHTYLARLLLAACFTVCALGAAPAWEVLVGTWHGPWSLAGRPTPSLATAATAATPVHDVRDVRDDALLVGSKRALIAAAFLVPAAERDVKVNVARRESTAEREAAIVSPASWAASHAVDSAAHDAPASEHPAALVAAAPE